MDRVGTPQRPYTAGSCRRRLIPSNRGAGTAYRSSSFGWVIRVMGPEELMAFQRHIVDTSSPELFRSSIALFSIRDDKPHPLGSGVLLQVADTHFLVSAAHVFDAIAIHDGTCCIPSGAGQGTPIHLNKIKIVTSGLPPVRSLKDHKLRLDDPHDVGVCELPTGIVSQLLPHRKFVSFHEVESCTPAPRANYMLLGYPESLKVVSNQGLSVLATDFRCITELVSGRRQDLEETIVVGYAPLGFDSNHNPIAPPNPAGMSGCGIWRLFDPAKPASQ